MFKCKIFPYRFVKKLKAQFIVRGYRQIEGVDFFETYAPAVSWATVCLLLILSDILNLASVQVNYTAAFFQSDVKEELYDQMLKEYTEEAESSNSRNAVMNYTKPQNFGLIFEGKISRYRVQIKCT